MVKRKKAAARALRTTASITGDIVNDVVLSANTEMVFYAAYGAGISVYRVWCTRGSFELEVRALPPDSNIKTDPVFYSLGEAANVVLDVAGAHFKVKAGSAGATFGYRFIRDWH